MQQQSDTFYSRLEAYKFDSNTALLAGTTVYYYSLLNGRNQYVHIEGQDINCVEVLCGLLCSSGPFVWLLYTLDPPGILRRDVSIDWLKQ